MIYLVGKIDISTQKISRSIKNTQNCFSFNILKGEDYIQIVRF